MHIRKTRIGMIATGLAAGAVNGIFGAAGGMVLVPALTLLTDLQDDEIFPASVSIILPVSIVSLCISIYNNGPDWPQTIPYLIGSVIGGIGAGILGKKIPTKWLHRILGILILWGGIRYLC